jgi:hypothetical protein
MIEPNGKVRDECPLGNERKPSLRRAVCVQMEAFESVKTVGFRSVLGWQRSRKSE